MWLVSCSVHAFRIQHFSSDQQACSHFGGACLSWQSRTASSDRQHGKGRGVTDDVSGPAGMFRVTQPLQICSSLVSTSIANVSACRGVPTQAGNSGVDDGEADNSNLKVLKEL